MREVEFLSHLSTDLSGTLATANGSTSLRLVASIVVGGGFHELLP